MDLPEKEKDFPKIPVELRPGIVLDSDIQRVVPKSLFPYAIEQDSGPRVFTQDRGLIDEFTVKSRR